MSVSVGLNFKKYTLNNHEIYHMKRVGFLCRKVAIIVNREIHKVDVNLIQISGKLHDIGKSYIDPSILNKTDKLTDYELEVIRNHSLEGAYELLNDKYDMEVVNNVLFHHENFDGSGYPFGIKGEEIPYGARIIRVCDTFDALTMDRPYREKLTSKEALKVMESMKNCFDLQIYNIFKKVINIDKCIVNNNTF